MNPVVKLESDCSAPRDSTPPAQSGVKVRPLRWLWFTLLVGLVGCYEGSQGTRPQPKFHLSLATQGVRIPAGGSAFVQVTLSRLNGFKEAVDLSLMGAPVGVLAKGRIEANATSLILPVTVAKELNPQALATTQVKGTSSHQTVLVPFRIEILAPLPPDSFSPHQVLASGGPLAGTTVSNHAVVSEATQATPAVAGMSLHRTGFHPVGLPNQ